MKAILQSIAPLLLATQAIALDISAVVLRVDYETVLPNSRL